MLAGLLFASVAVAQEPVAPPLADIPSVADLRAEELDRLHHRGRTTLVSGAVLALVAWPAAGLTGLAMEANCRFECMSAAFGAAGTWSVLTTAGAVTLGVGGVQFALAPHRARHRAEEEYAGAHFSARLSEL